MILFSSLSPSIQDPSHQIAIHDIHISRALSLDSMAIATLVTQGRLYKSSHKGQVIRQNLLDRGVGLGQGEPKNIKIVQK